LRIALLTTFFLSPSAVVCMFIPPLNPAIVFKVYE
jgi:hypothetical protein